MIEKPNTTSRDRPIRLCLMIDTLSGSADTRVLGGTEKQVLSLIDQLDRSKVVPTLCLLDGSSEASRGLEPDCCDVLRLGIRSLHAPTTAVRAWRFARFLRRERIDVLQIHYPMSTYFAAPIARLAGVRCVVGTRRNLGHWMGRSDRLLGRLYSRLMTATLANSQASRDSVIADRCAAPDSVFVVPNGIDLERFADAAAPGGRSPGRSPQVGVVSNLRPLKNLDVFVRAAARLAESYPDARFLIAGEGQSRADIRALAEQLGLAKRIELLGAVSNIPQFLAGLDVAVLCSQTEGLSNALLEYMAAARPIVATSVGGNCELIEDNRNGLLVAPGSVEDLASAIGRLLRDQSLATRLGEAARQKAVEQYAADSQARRCEALYQRLLATSGRQATQCASL